ncbi:hypothetical protein Pst134EA_000380 [Puccinia striiformis f. sp. tritici]|uniref:hypothetical protein n=1 Tax=Puccinia striiformis f. sp. tritici TaxID=168172 RepID=UPI0020072D12|nr:hypothetical protein Pst134EA_000380 [Puccinia striiformis f. sp. tritici]KAH9473309.1 hypothetical protein Pst134EA_000380 [Puccinia striiformis f. sp. tritici]
MLSSTHQMTLVLTGITWLARTTLAAVGCDATEFIDRNQCARAISQIVYEQPGNTLDRVSTRFAKLSGNCTILVGNPEKGAVTKQQIEAGFTSILDQCKANSGYVSLPNSLYLSVQDHRLGYDSGDIEPRTLTCGLNTNAPLTVDKDCHTAYNSIPVDKKSRLLGEDGQPTAVVEKTFKTCTVLIKTTDNSTLIGTKSEIGSVVSKTIKDCKGKSGLIGSPKGGAGINGLTAVRVRSSAFCGSHRDTEGKYQSCY